MEPQAEVIDLKLLRNLVESSEQDRLREAQKRASVYWGISIPA